MGTPEGKGGKKGAKILFKGIIAENFPNLGKELDTYVHEANTTPNYIHEKRPFPKHIILKLSKVSDKERILKSLRGKKTVT